MDAGGGVRKMSREVSRGWMNWALVRSGRAVTRLLILSCISSCMGLSAVYGQAVDLGDYTLDDKQLKDAVYGRGFNIGLDEKAIDKLMEIQQHLQSAQWVKAFRIIDANRNLWSGKQVPRQDGFTLPVDEFLSRLVASLPAEARESFESYFTARAKQLLDRANTLPAAEEIAELRRLQTYYSLTSAGSASANQLGDAYFERGRFRQAANVWEALLRDHSLDLNFEKRIHGKLLLAYARTGERAKLSATIATLEQRFAGESIRIGPDDVSLEDLMDRFGAEAEEVPESGRTLPVAKLPPRNREPIWSVSWKTEQRQSGVPAKEPHLRFDGDRMVVNLGFATSSYKLANGKVVWSSGLNKKKKGSLLGLVQRVVQEQAGLPVLGIAQSDQGSSGEFGMAERQSVSNGRLTFVQRVSKDKGVSIQAFDSKTGRLQWMSADNGDYKLAGNIVVWQDTLVAAAYSTKSPSELHLLFYDSEGNLDSTQRLGTVVGINNPYRGTSAQPSPTLVNYEQYVLVMPNDGAVIAVDPESDAKIDWIFRFAAARTENANQNMVFWSGMQMPKTYIRPSAIVRDGILYFRDDEERTLHAMNPAKRKVLWKRSMEKDAQILGVDEQYLFVLAKEPDQGHTLQMIDRETHEMVHCPRLPQFVNGRFVVGQDHVLISTNRGIYRASKRTGDIDMPYRSKALPAQEHSLYLKDSFLVAVTESNLQVFELAP